MEVNLSRANVFNLKKMGISMIALLVLLGIAYAFSLAQTPMHADKLIDVSEGEKYWQKQIETVGGAAAHKQLAEAIAGLIPGQQHTAAHIFGGALYEEEGLDGLAVCDTRFLYGCFHEFLTRAVVHSGLSILPKLEEMCLASPHANAPLSCEHGLGHAILSYFGYEKEDLNSALEACRTLKHDAASSCPSGVFMEYNLRTFVEADGSAVRKISNGDFYDPCREYRSTEAKRCVRQLPLWWQRAIFSNTLDRAAFSWMGQKCRALPQELSQFKAGCFRTIGFIAAVAVNPEVESIDAYCETAADESQDFAGCILAAGMALKNNKGLTKGLELCAQLPDEDKLECQYYVQFLPLGM